MSDVSTTTPHRLDSILAGLIASAGITQAELADQTGVDQSHISRISTGVSPISAELAAAWCRACRADADTTALVVELATQAAKDAGGVVTLNRWPRTGRRALATQQRWRILEGSAGLVETFGGAQVPGAIQTAAYVAAVAQSDPGRVRTLDELADIVEERRRRLPQMISDPTRRAMLIVAETALLGGLGGTAVMTEQCDYLAELVGKHPNVHIGVIPVMALVEVSPLSGYTMYDRAAVVVTIQTASGLTRDPVDAERYGILFDELYAAAVWGPAAKRIFTAVGDRYRAAG